mgnify:CR=1 FL=1
MLEKTHGVRVLYRGADLSKPADIAELMVSAIEAFGAVDILVNNAVVRHFAPIHEFPVEAWDRAMAVNISAAFHTIRLAVPGMRERRWGRIVNLSSIYRADRHGEPGGLRDGEDCAYRHDACGRARDRRLWDYLQRDLPGFGADAFHRCAGPSDHVRRGAVARRRGREFLAGKQPSGRFVETENVAALIAFLCGKPGATSRALQFRSTAAGRPRECALSPGDDYAKLCSRIFCRRWWPAF